VPSSQKQPTFGGYLFVPQNVNGWSEDKKSPWDLFVGVVCATLRPDSKIWAGGTPRSPLTHEALKLASCLEAQI